MPSRRGPRIWSKRQLSDPHIRRRRPKFTQYTEVDLARFTGCSPVELFSEGPFPPITDQPYLLTLAPYSFLWFRLLKTEKAQEMPIP